MRVCINPFGTVYNPSSIASQIARITADTAFTADDLFFASGSYHSFMAHSSLSSTDSDTALLQLNNALTEAHAFIKDASVAIVTLGTAMVYRHRDTGAPVANCHKLPADRFTSTMLSVTQISEELESIRESFLNLSPSIKMIFTVSPIRYVSYGLHENQISKASLLLGVEEICRTHSDDCFYFPSYETVIDDLRDYRFYESDMKHPSATAADYIYDVFSRSYYNVKTQEMALKCRKLTRRLAHRPLTDNQEAIKIFRSATDSMASDLLSAYPELADAMQTYMLINSTK